MKKLLIASLVATLALTACNKQDAPPPAENKAETATPAPADAHADHDHAHEGHDHDDHEHKDGEHNHEHSHEGHDHAGHHHHDHEGDKYTCDGGKSINVMVHDHEGEIEAHAIIDDVEYDLHPDTGKQNQYISKEEGLNNKGMTMTLDNGKATFNDLDGKALLSCTKS